MKHFTPATVAGFMASMITELHDKNVKLLDAGAGTGVLTYHAVFRCFSLGANKVHAVLYEIDGSLIPDLRERMESLVAHFGIRFTYTILDTDFLSQRPWDCFHIACINPPRNVYSQFVHKVSEHLVPGGQLVAITPRSFMNGLQFTTFRNEMLKVMRLHRIHLFLSRTKVFDNVTQETVICKWVKEKQYRNVIVSTCQGMHDITDCKEYSFHSDIVISGNGMIRIPTSSHEACIIRDMDRLPRSFSEAGYQVKCGTIVKCRVKEYLITKDTGIPLIQNYNIQTTGMISHKKDLWLTDNTYAVSNKPYVLIKQLCDKLVAAVNTLHTDYVGIENHILYIDTDKPYWLVKYLNSEFVRTYMHCVCGSTQVNVSDIKQLRFPNDD